MTLSRILAFAVAIAAVAAATVVCVVAAAFAVYALATIYLGPAGAAAVVVGVFALIAVGAAWAALRKASPKTRSGGKTTDLGLIDRAFGIARERPMIALGAAAVAVTVLLRNPAMVSALVSAFLAGGATKPKR